MTRALSLCNTGRIFARLSEKIGRMIERLVGGRDRYRPEKHYMRGPGPKSSRAGAPRHEQE
jgi:hypothetical protein